MSTKPTMDEIKARWAKASSGPWEARGLAYHTTVGKVGDYRSLARLGDPLDGEAWRNAEAIANAPADIDYLLGELDQALAKLAAVNGERAGAVMEHHHITKALGVDR